MRLFRRDEIDIIVDVFGAKVFFELKDREFGLGDAYPFSYRFHRYGGDYGVVISTDAIASEAAKFFNEQGGGRSAQFKFFSNQNDLKADLVSYLKEICVDTLVRQVTKNLASSGIDERGWIREWLK